MRLDIAARTRRKDKRILNVLATGKYTVTRSGRIFNNSHRNTGERRELQYFTGKDGYLLVHLRGLRIVRVHRVVALAFLPPPHGCKWVNHKNGRVQQNNAANLEWGSPVETVQKAAKLGLRHDQGGDNNNGARLSEKRIREIRQLIGSASQREIAVKFGVAQTTVSSIARRVNWGHVP